jgi:hypothetical protein
MEADWYHRVFLFTRISREKNTELNFVTTRHGYRYSTSVGGTLTGRGGNIVIIDDPIKPEDAISEATRSGVNEWFDNTLYSPGMTMKEGSLHDALAASAANSPEHKALARCLPAADQPD